MISNNASIHEAVVDELKLLLNSKEVHAATTEIHSQESTIVWGFLEEIYRNDESRHERNTWESSCKS